MGTPSPQPLSRTALELLVVVDGIGKLHYRTASASLLGEWRLPSQRALFVDPHRIT
jgi:hypothetical protein